MDAKPIRSRNGFVVPCLDIQKPGSASVVLRLVNNPSHWNKLRKLLKKMQSRCAFRGVGAETGSRAFTTISLAWQCGQLLNARKNKKVGQA